MDADGFFLRIGPVFAISILSASLIAQSFPTPACPANRPIDDIIAQMHKEQHPPRNKNPLPQTACITIFVLNPFAWCRDTGMHRPAPVEPAPPAETRATAQAEDEASSKTPIEKCDEAMTKVREAAHNVDVGDFNFSKKNYTGALMRYQDAIEEKTDDPAIHVRLGRAWEN